MSGHGGTRVNSPSGETTKEDSERQRNSGQNGTHKATTRAMIPIGEEIIPHKEC